MILFQCKCLYQDAYLIQVNMMMKTYQMSMKQNTLDKGGKKGTWWVDPTLSKNKKPPIAVDHKGNTNKSNIQTPPIATNILDKGKGKTPKRTFSQEEPSLIITMCFKIKVVCTHYNIIDTPLLVKWMQNQKTKASKALCAPCHVNTLMKKVVHLLMQIPKYLYG